VRRFSGLGHWREATEVRDDEAYFDGADKPALRDGRTGEGGGRGGTANADARPAIYQGEARQGMSFSAIGRPKKETTEGG